MTLDKSKLQDALEGLSEGPGADVPKCAHKWAAAVGDYFQTIQLAALVPASVTVTAAQGFLETALGNAFQGRDKDELATSMEKAFKMFAAQVGMGMTQLYSPVMPPGPVGFATLWSPPFEPTHVKAAAKVAAAIHTWALTGTATLILPPKTPATWT